MKKVLLTLSLVLGLSQVSHAVIIGDSGMNPCRPGHDALGCALSTTFALPTLMIAAEENLSPEDRQEFIRAEARNLVDGITTESVLLQAVADKMGRNVYDVAQEILLEK